MKEQFDHKLRLSKANRKINSMKNIKVGDVGFAYNCLKTKQDSFSAGLIDVNTLIRITNTKTSYRYDVATHIDVFKHFFPIDLSKPLQNEINRFLNLKNDEL